MPSTILCAGSNYREHNAEKLGSPTSGKEPEFFLKTADCVVGPEEPIIYDAHLTRKLDCETELAVVIGKSGRHIPKEHALEHVFGYTIANDVTARDRQVRRQGDFTWYELGRGKAFDSSAPLGPCIVTADEVPDPQHLAISTRINGELRQSSNTRNMIWTCADLIHFFSINFTLKPGMIIITGTPAGTAWSTDKELGGNWTPSGGVIAATRYCLPGDLVESEIEKIGVLRNPVA
jgi:2-keto-4-pentenoate hydratase/2-oxohepta-3-ene-1,7-dioic acid hydratase in catechol pathway